MAFNLSYDLQVQLCYDFVDPEAMMQKFNAEEVRYLLIGSMASAMHNASFGSADWDFWIACEARQGSTTSSGGSDSKGRPV